MKLNATADDIGRRKAYMHKLNKVFPSDTGMTPTANRGRIIIAAVYTLIKPIVEVGANWGRGLRRVGALFIEICSRIRSAF